MVGRVDAALADCVVRAGEPTLDRSVRVRHVSLDLLVDGDPWLTSSNAGEIVGGVNHRILQRAYPHADGWR